MIVTSYLKAIEPIKKGLGISQSLNKHTLTAEPMIGVAVENAKIGDYFRYMPVTNVYEVTLGEVVDITVNTKIKSTPTGWVNASADEPFDAIILEPVDKTVRRTSLLV